MNQVNVSVKGVCRAVSAGTSSKGKACRVIQIETVSPKGFITMVNYRSWNGAKYDIGKPASAEVLVRAYVKDGQAQLSMDEF